MPPKHESESLTRKQRIDPKLDDAGWVLPKKGTTPLRGAFRTEEYGTATGPADYVLWLDNKIVGVVEAKRVGVGPQNVLKQAERYSAGLGQAPPFLYSTNGEVIWFHDLRHERNLSREVSRFHTPAALGEMLERDFEAACDTLLEMPHDHDRLRPYQKDANQKVDQAIAERHRSILVAMATGCGKTFTLVNQIYRLMKSGVARRVLFLVDRRALAAQAVRAFASFTAEPGKKFDQIYEVYSSKFQAEDLDDDEKFDPKKVPPEYLTNPRVGHAFVYVCTIQRMAVGLFGPSAVLGSGDDSEEDDDQTRLPIPIHTFDLIVADECHRGYTSQQESIWRDTLNHFDAIKIGLTATPAKHTAAFFTHKAVTYSYENAVRDGYLVDYDVVRVRSNVRMNGLFLREGERVEVVDTATGKSTLDSLEDEREFDTADLERKITAPESNRKIIAELKKYALEFEKERGRFPKTLIFAANDLPHTSHANQLVQMAREAFGKGDDFVIKITGSKDVEKPLKRIKEFRNRTKPAIAVTVDMLTTGVDIPDLEFLVLLRPVKSRTLFVQMIGRGTRKPEKLPDKERFTVFDCFDGTLVAFFKDSTDVTGDMPAPASRTIAEIIDDIWANKDRDYNIGVLTKRLHRVDRSVSGEGRETLAAFFPDGDLAKFARELAGKLESDFGGTMKLLRSPELQAALTNYPRPDRAFMKAIEQDDQVTSEWLVRDVFGNQYKPADYLEAFSKYVKENQAEVEAIRVLLGRPRDWRAEALSELRKKLKLNSLRFTEKDLQRAHAVQYRKPLVEIISMVKHAADEQAPLLTAAERVELAFERVTRGMTFTTEQQQWLDRIRQVMQENLSIDPEDFEYQDALSSAGGWGAARKLFGPQKLDDLIHRLNEAIAA